MVLLVSSEQLTENHLVSPAVYKLNQQIRRRLGQKNRQKLGNLDKKIGKKSTEREIRRKGDENDA